MHDLKEKINDFMNTLQKNMENNDHINNQYAVQELINDVSQYWPILSEEDREYIQAAQQAIDEQISWNI
jgi:protein tyrosine/serine phosphatase